MLAAVLLTLAPTPVQDEPLELLDDLGPGWAFARGEGLDGPLAAETDEAIDEGLAWLAWRQRRDGGWNGGLGVTALVTLAFLARDPESDVVDRAMSRLGVAIDVSEDPREVARIALALVEGAALVREDLRVVASEALERFREVPDAARSDADYAWRVAGTVLATGNGVERGSSPTEVHAELARRSRAWTPADSHGSLEALLAARGLAGFEDDRPTLVRAERLVDAGVLPRWPEGGGVADLESWMWGATATALHGGAVRAAYLDALRTALLAGRQADGSWPDVTGTGLGPEGATALAVLALDGPRRYRRAWRVDAMSPNQGVVVGMTGGPEGRRAPATQPATDRAIDWLLSAQGKDGSWADGDVGATSLALLALQGEGNALKEGPHAREFTAGIRWLRGAQDFETGRYVDATDLDNALTMAVLAECYLLSRSHLVLINVRKGLGSLEPSFGAEDDVVAAWVATAVASAIQAEVHVPADLFVAVEARYAPGGPRPESIAPAVLMRALLHRTAPEGEWRARLDALAPTDAADPMELYFATHATFQVGGDAWEEWHAACRPILRARVGRDGSAGSVRETALAALTLQVEHRYARVLGDR